MKINICFRLGILAVALAAVLSCQNESKDDGKNPGPGPVEPEPPKTVNLEAISLPESIRMTLYSSQKLAPEFTPSNATNKAVTWTTSDAEILSVSADGTFKALQVSEDGSDLEAVITVKSADGGFEDTCTVTVTMEPTVNVVNLVPLKESFNDYFLLGNVFMSYDFVDEEQTAFDERSKTIPHHYNVITFENETKPVFLNGANPGVYDAAGIARAKRMLSTAKASGIQHVVGHALMWHSQSAPWHNANYFTRTTLQTPLPEDHPKYQESLTGNPWYLPTNDEAAQAVVRELLKEYVTYIVTQFKGTLYSWDVLNEAFVDSPTAAQVADWTTAFRNNHFWRTRAGADFVYVGFLAAREADPDAILVYNDYNLEVNRNKTNVIINMANELNTRYKQEYGVTRNLIEVIGVQAHINAGDFNQTHFQETGEWKHTGLEYTLDEIRKAGMKAALTELDVLGQTYNDFEATRRKNNTTDPSAKVKDITHANRLRQAEQYKALMKTLIAYQDVIDRVTFWGNSDIGVADYGWDTSGTNFWNGSHWRWEAEPMPFTRPFPSGEGMLGAKPLYYKMLEALQD
jgi:endo-1,4-beta-xylanase